MREVTKIMIKQFNIMKLGYDFMGYKVDRKASLSFHHLIIPRRISRESGIGEGYLFWNGSILNQNTSHEYLHLIEAKDMDIFLAITSEMIEQNIKGKLDIDNIRYIHDCLKTFEKEHYLDMTKKNKKLIKKEYIEKRIQF